MIWTRNPHEASKIWCLHKALGLIPSTTKYCTYEVHTYIRINITELIWKHWDPPLWGRLVGFWVIWQDFLPTTVYAVYTLLVQAKVQKSRNSVHVQFTVPCDTVRSTAAERKTASFSSSVNKEVPVASTHKGMHRFRGVYLPLPPWSLQRFNLIGPGQTMANKTQNCTMWKSPLCFQSL